MEEATTPPQASRSRLRVLLLIRTLGHGGAERLLVNHARARDREAFEYEVAFLSLWLDDLAPELENAGVPVSCLRGGKEWDLRWAWRLRRLLARHPFHVLHMHSPYAASIARLVAQTLPRGARPALVYSEHGIWQSHTRLGKLANRFTYRLDDATLAVSKGVKETVAPRLRSRVEVLTHGVDVEWIRHQRRFREEVRAELGVGKGHVLVGTVGNFVADKAYPDLLEAARLVTAAALPVIFVSVGHGALEAQVRALHREMGLGDTFQFVGYRADAVRVMSAFDVFTLASVREGLPVAVMEALALGLPLVVTAVGGVPEAVTNGVEGTLVPPSRPDQLAAAIGELAVDAPLRARMSRAAAARAESFRMEPAVRRLERLYLEVALPKTYSSTSKEARRGSRASGLTSDAPRSGRW